MTGWKIRVSLRKKEMMTTTNFGMQLVTVKWIKYKCYIIVDMLNGLTPNHSSVGKMYQLVLLLFAAYVYIEAFWNTFNLRSALGWEQEGPNFPLRLPSGLQPFHLFHSGSHILVLIP